ncbi:AAA family ATPase, partial [Phenylobacterium sp.]|uniref:AAA family ATPase n=1 Tax=Phenylobacterium sp. TaxID=1871053 RepID=UPI001218F97E
MRDLSKYQLSTLRTDPPLQRGWAEGLSPILLIALQERTATADSVARLENEYGLQAELDAAWAARPVALTRHRERISLVLEDPGGEPLERLCGHPWPIADFLRVAIPLAGALRKVHARGLVHKDIKPANILADVASGAVWLTGFGIATRAAREQQESGPPEAIAGTLAYMAPEQTGRINRTTDSRSDLYGLGVTLYELLTGTLPFTASDPMELIHSHIAKKPVAPNEVVAAIPAQLSAIILKLLAKTAEERYQTAAGLESDLKRCLALLEAHGHINPFPLGAQDAPNRLVIPEELYGRKAEVETLLTAFDQVAARGTTAVVFVSGDSGAGKSSLVNELHRTLAASGGLFASGKFDQYMRDIPYATLAQAFQGLVRSLLSRSESELGLWRDALREALGLNGQLIVNQVPELELVIGKQQPVADLAPQDAQRRFQMVFRRFVGVFARPEHPLALFLDDLQWLDPATLELLEHLATHSDVKGLLLIGAYRTGEVEPSHPLRESIEAIRQSKVEVREIALAPLSIEDIGQFVAEALHCKPQAARPLARLLHERTAGNPFFAVQFLASLALEDLLVFDSDALAWRWDIDRIRAKNYSDNVVGLMTEKLGRLSVATQDALIDLAGLGNTADVATLALVRGQSEDTLQAMVAEAVVAGLIVLQSDAYAFLHDQIQQAAYSLIPEDRRAGFHLRLGRALLDGLSPDALNDRVFDVASQLNRGADELTDPEDMRRVARLNLQAGRKAKESAAHASASAFLAAGAALLGPEGWERQYDLLFRLQLERAECEFLGSNHGSAERLIDELIDRAASKPDLAAACSLRVKLYVVKSELVEATTCALTCLESLGVMIPAHPTRDQLLAEFDDMWCALSGRPIEILLDLPLMTDPALLGAMHLLSQTIDATSTSDNLMCALLCRMVTLSLRHGVSGASAIACACLADRLGSLFGRYQDGYRFAQVARDVVARHGFAVYEAEVQLAMGLAAVWTQPFETVLDYVRSACRITTEAGDVTRVCFSYPLIVNLRLLRGEPLEAVRRESEVGLEFARAAGFHEMADLSVSQQRFIANMQGRTATFSTFSDAQFDQDKFEAALRGHQWTMPYWISKLKARFLSADYGQALAASEMLNTEALSGLGTAVVRLEFCYYTGLTVAALFDHATEDARTKLRDLLEAHRAQLHELAQVNPASFGDKFALVAAEIARIEGRDADAMQLYEQAIQSAREHGFVQHEALAYEVAARFYAARGIESIAEAYLRGARRCYLRWGADGKVRQLEQLHPHLREAPIPRSAPVAGGEAIARLDVEAVLRVSQALSSEIRLGELIQKLMQIALEHAGAERGLLILHRGGELTLEATAVTRHEKSEVTARGVEVTASDLPLSLLNYVVRTKEGVVLDDASLPNPYRDDIYVQQTGVRSVLCLPIANRANLVGALYLENSLTPYAFTSERVSVLEMLSSQAAISLENARLYSDLQQENSDRKRVQEELRRSEAYLQEAQRLGRIGSFVLDPSSGKMLASPELLRILGLDFDAQSTTLDKIVEYIHPDDRRPVEQQRTRAILEKSGWMAGYRLLLPDGVIKFVESAADPVLDESGQVVEYIGVLSDVTEFKLAEQKMKMNETLLSEAQKLSHTGSYILDGPFGKSIWTDEMFRVFEFDQAEEPSVEKAVQRIHPDDQDRMRQFAAAAPDERPAGRSGNGPPVEYRLLMPDGRIKFVLSLRAQAGPEFSGVGTIIGATMDVTDRKKAEEALLRSQAELAHASRVNTMGELTAALAHEVNQPITAVIANANASLRFLSAETLDLEEAREAVGAIIQAGRRAGEIVSRTRELFKKGVPQRDLVDLDDLVRSTVLLLESEARRYSASVHTWLAAGAPAILGDRVQLQQVILNLIMNSLEAMKDVEGARELAVRTRIADDQSLVVSVSDTGVGLPQNDANRIFDTFFSTKPDGTGMGLSI